MILPPCPLRLKRSFVWRHLLGGLLLLAIGLAAGVGYAWWQFDTVQQLLSESRIWNDGVAAPEAEVEGEVRTTKLIFHSYDLEVRYVDANGASHRHPLEFDTLGGTVNQQADVNVRYLPDDPGRFALSWGIEVATSRWVSIVFMGLVGVGLVGGSFAFLGWGVLRRLAVARACAQESHEVVVQIARATQHSSHGVITIVYHYAGHHADGQAISGKISFPVKHKPLFADAAGQTMVVRVAPESVKRPVVVRSDFHPYVLTAEEQAAAHAAIARMAVATKPLGT